MIYLSLFMRFPDHEKNIKYHRLILLNVSFVRLKLNVLVATHF